MPPQNIEFLNWYVGILLSALSLLGAFVIWKIKSEYEDFKSRNAVTSNTLNNTKDDVDNILSSLDMFREKMTFELHILKESVRPIPKIRDQISSLEISLVKVSEQIKYMQTLIDSKDEHLGRVIKK